jgi:hypothetical protein
MYGSMGIISGYVTVIGNPTIKSYSLSALCEGCCLEATGGCSTLINHFARIWRYWVPFENCNVAPVWSYTFKGAYTINGTLGVCMYTSSQTRSHI